MNSRTLWIVGCGNMGRAMLDRWLDTGLDPGLVTVIDPALPALRDGVRVIAKADPHSAPPAAVLLAVKPQVLGVAVQGVVPMLNATTLVVSILAGVTLQALRAPLHGNAHDHSGDAKPARGDWRRRRRAGWCSRSIRNRTRG